MCKGMKQRVSLVKCKGFHILLEYGVNVIWDLSGDRDKEAVESGFGDVCINLIILKILINSCITHGESLNRALGN